MHTHMNESAHIYTHTNISLSKLTADKWINTTKRIQGVNKCGGMGVVLGEQAQGEGGDWVVAPRTVQLHKQLTALLECVDQSHLEGLECMYWYNQGI